MASTLLRKRKVKKVMPDRPAYILELGDLAVVRNHMTTNKKQTTRVGSLFHVYSVGPNSLPPFRYF
jgi:hypothetical protein